MARNTLPAIDPLAQLGIGVPEAFPENTEAKRHRPSLRSGRKRDTPSTITAPDNPAHLPPLTPSEVSDPTIPPTSLEQPTVHTPRARPPLRAEPLPAAATPKVKFNARIPPELAEEVRDCVVALYSTHGLTIDALTAEALRREVDRLKKQLNRGEAFPKRPHAPKPGRPVR